MPLDNAWSSKPVPLVKAASFTTLTQGEVASMRSFSKANDSRIVNNEVFFCNQQRQGDAELDLMSDLKHSRSAATPNLGKQARREKYEQMQPNGQSVTVQRKAVVLWNNHTVSPAILSQVFLTDIL